MGAHFLTDFFFICEKLVLGSFIYVFLLPRWVFRPMVGWHGIGGGGVVSVLDWNFCRAAEMRDTEKGGVFLVGFRLECWRF